MNKNPVQNENNFLYDLNIQIIRAYIGIIHDILSSSSISGKIQFSRMNSITQRNEISSTKYHKLDIKKECIFNEEINFTEINLKEDNIEAQITLIINSKKKKYKPHQINFNDMEFNKEIKLHLSKKIYIIVIIKLIPNNKQSSFTSNNSPIHNKNDNISSPIKSNKLAPGILPPSLANTKESLFNNTKQNTNKHDKIQSFKSETISNDKSTAYTDHIHHLNNELIDFNNTYEIMISEHNIDINVEPNDNLVTCALIIGIDSKNIKLLENSNDYPSMCNHKECSLLSAFEPTVIDYYKNNTCPLNINELTAQMCFPNGIKLCYFADECNDNKISKPYESFTNVIQIETGELFYIITAFSYIRMSIYEFESIYKINPLRGYAKFEDLVPSDSNSTISKKMYSEKEISKIINMISSLFIKEEILIPHGISLISKYPYISQINKVLQALIKTPYNDINFKIINQLLNQVPIPEKHQRILYYLPYDEIPLHFPSNKNYPLNQLYQINLCKIFLDISTDNIILIFHLLLCEQKLLFIDDNFQNLSINTLSFIHFLYPLTWVHTYTPILSYTTMRFLQSIIPFVMGINELLFNEAIKHQYIDKDNKGIIFVLLKKNYLTYELSLKQKSKSSILKYLNIPELPDNVYEYLEKQIRLIKKDIRNVKNYSNIENDIVFNRRIQKTFLIAMILILGEYKNHIFFTNEEMPYFNVDSFIESKPKGDKLFYSEFLSTQLFSQFLYNEKLLLLTKKQKVINNNKRTKISKAFVDTYYFNKELKKWEETFNNININNKRNSSHAVRGYSMKKLSKEQKNKNSYHMRNYSNKLNTSINSSSQNSCNASKFSNNVLMQNNLSLFRNDSMSSMNTIVDGNHKQSGQMIRKSGVIDLIVPPFFINDDNVRKNKNLIEDYIKRHKSEYESFQLKQKLSKNYIRNKPFTFDNIRTKKLNKYYKPSDSALLHQKNIIKDKFKNVNELNSYYLNKSNNEVSNHEFQSTNKHSNTNLARVASIYAQSCNDNKQINDIEDIKTAINDWYINIITPESKNRSFKILDISSFLKRSKYRDIFTHLLTQSSILDDTTNKMLSNSNFDKMLKAIKIALNNLHSTEYKNCKLLTLALFSYYKLCDKNGCVFLFEELCKYNQQNQNCVCKLWRNEELWIKWYTEDLNEKQKEEEDNFPNLGISDYEYEEEYNEQSTTIAKKLLFRMENIMKDLKIDYEFIEKVILSTLASKYLDADDFLEIEKTFH